MSDHDMAMSYVVDAELLKLRDANAELVWTLDRCIRQFENMDEQLPTDAGCIECTAGTVPNNRNTGLCGYHSARAILAKVQP